MAVKPIPDGYHSVTPYLTVEGASGLIEFLKNAFGAEVTHRMARPDGTIGHAEVRIGDSAVMLGDAQGPFNPVASTLYLYVEDTDAVYKRAMDAGGTSVMAPVDQFYGDRNAAVKDPCGNHWCIATHIEDVTSEELQRRAKAKGMG